MIPYQHFTGRLTADPELRHTSSGTPVANFRLAQNDSKYNEQTREWETTTQLFLTVTCWEHLAEQVAAALTRGDQVLVHGKLRTREWQDRDGNARSTTEIAAKSVKLLQNLPKLDQQQAGGFGQPQQTSTHGGFGQQSQTQAAHANDPWGSAPAANNHDDSDEVPF